METMVQGHRRFAETKEVLGTDEGPDVTDPEAIPDDRLRLIFTCCHPALPGDSQVALTLRPSVSDTCSPS